MSTGYEIVSSTFTVAPNDPSVYEGFPANDWSPATYFAEVSLAAPAGKRWVCPANNMVNNPPDGGATNVRAVFAWSIALNSDGTEYTTIFRMERDENGDLITTDFTLRVIAIDA